MASKVSMVVGLVITLLGAILSSGVFYSIYSVKRHKLYNADIVILLLLLIEAMSGAEVAMTLLVSILSRGYQIQLGDGLCIAQGFMSINFADFNIVLQFLLAIDRYHHTVNGKQLSLKMCLIIFGIRVFVSLACTIALLFTDGYVTTPSGIICLYELTGSSASKWISLVDYIISGGIMFVAIGLYLAMYVHLSKVGNDLKGREGKQVLKTLLFRNMGILTSVVTAWSLYAVLCFYSIVTNLDPPAWVDTFGILLIMANPLVTSSVLLYLSNPYWNAFQTTFSRLGLKARSSVNSRAVQHPIPTTTQDANVSVM